MPTMAAWELIRPLLKEMKDLAENHVDNDVKRAVIAVPYYITEN